MGAGGLAVSDRVEHETLAPKYAPIARTNT